VWAMVRASGRHVACFIEDQEKVSPKSFGIRIRDPANFKFSIGQKVEKSIPYVYRGIDTSGFRVWKFILLTS
jgi:hypothetical protein